MAWHSYKDYVSVVGRRANARREVEKLRKRGLVIEPVEIVGRTIADSFWGKSWCEHLESFCDFESRLPRGRTDARNGSICHLAITPGRVNAIVSGSELYRLDISVTKLAPQSWDNIKQRCTGQIGTMLELLQGKLSDQVMAIVADREHGLFPQPHEIQFNCACPDFAYMCKHVAAVLYGIGHRLDSQPELLFALRDVDPKELIASDISMPQADAASSTFSANQLADIFGITLDEEPQADTSSSNTKRDLNITQITAGNLRLAKKSLAPIKAAPSVRRKTAKAANERDVNILNLRPTGKSIARLRKQAGCNMTTFAQLVGVTPATVSRWESTPNQLRLNQASYDAIIKLHTRLSRDRQT